MLRGLKDTLALLIVFLVSIPTIANANTTTTTTTPTTTTTTTIPENQVVETETFDGGTNGGEQVTDIEVPPTENNLVKIDDTWKIDNLDVVDTDNLSSVATEKDNELMSEGKLIAARNKGHLKNKGETALDLKGM